MHVLLAWTEALLAAEAPLFTTARYQSASLGWRCDD